MAQTFRLNGTELTHINDAQWSEQPEGDYFNGLKTKNKWRQVTIAGSDMEETQFDLIYARLGKKVSITIPPYNDRNSDYVTYYGANLLSVDGNHDGPIVRSVRASLLVKI